MVDLGGDETTNVSLTSLLRVAQIICDILDGQIALSGSHNLGKFASNLCTHSAVCCTNGISRQWPRRRSLLKVQHLCQCSQACVVRASLHADEISSGSTVLVSNTLQGRCLALYSTPSTIRHRSTCFSLCCKCSVNLALACATSLAH